jgi:Dolichyl-phosphate-mannose-protein mannosyltransferase
MDEPSNKTARDLAWIVGAFAAAKLLLHLIANALPPGHFEFFRDELYYLDCARHLAWGYVDQPPLIALIARGALALGSSLVAIRFLAALAGAAKIVFAALFARALGAKRTGVALACLAMLVAPANLTIDDILTMNVFEALFWAGAALVVLRIVRGGNRRLWLLFGLIVGVGTLNKYSMIFFAACLVAGLLLTRERRVLWSGWFLAGAAAAVLVALPNFFWQWQHGFPFLVLLHHISLAHRDVHYGPLGFLVAQTIAFLPLTLPMWAGGVIWLIAGRTAPEDRFLGWTFVVLAALFVAMGGKYYYLFPAFPIALAAGGAMVQRWMSGGRWRPILTGVYAAATAAMGFVFLPSGLPVLSERDFMRWRAAVPGALTMTGEKFEHQRVDNLPQIYADMHGWEELADKVARVYRSLPRAERARCGIYVQNYGQAGAIDFYGRSLGLPPAICGHQNYFYWGPHGYTGKCLVLVSGDEKTEREHFSSVTPMDRMDDPWQRPDERQGIFLCRGLHWDLRQIWPKLRHWD